MIKKIAIALSLIALIVLFPVLVSEYLEWQFRWQTEAVIQSINEFHDTEGAFPRTLGELGYETDNLSESGPFYNVVGNDHYQIFYVEGETLFYTYDSHSRKWSHSIPMPARIPVNDGRE